MDSSVTIPLIVFGMGTVISLFVVVLIKAIYASLKLFSKSAEKK
jgi:hypothetical protein